MSIRVMHLVRPADGGMREHVRELAGGLPAGKFRTLVVCPPESALFRQLPSRIETNGLRVEDGIRPWADMQSVIALWNLLKREPVDILHMHGAKSALIGRIAARLCKQPPRRVCTIHNFVEPDSRILRAVYLRAERKLAAGTDRYIAVSNALAERLQRQLGIDRDKVVTVHNGLPPVAKRLSRQRARELMGIPPDAFVFGSVARLVPEKGLRDLVLAFRMLYDCGYDAYLAVIGDGPERRELQALCAGDSGRVRWLGAIEEAARLMPGFDVYVQSSRKEGFGLAVMEAMREGVPVIGTDAGGVPEVIGGPEAGVLVPAGSPPRLFQAMLELLCDAGRRQALADGGRRRVREHFSLQRMIRETIRVYDEVLSDGRASE